ncbi:MAG: 16S rRNA processing protein RimM [Bacilli bacterium]|nr:16S rRNA processing protein RimM [Bacilli bacterium]
MEYIYIGKIVNTHGIKGELRILSDFQFINKVFVPGFNFYIGKDKIKETVKTYRHHKIFEMVTFVGYTDINQVLKYLNEDVYILKDDLKLNKEEYLDSDLIGMKIIENDNNIGTVTDITYASKNNKLIEANINNKKVYIPFNKEFVLDINLQDRVIRVKLIKGMI